MDGSIVSGTARLGAAEPSLPVGRFSLLPLGRLRPMQDLTARLGVLYTGYYLLLRWALL